MGKPNRLATLTVRKARKLIRDNGGVAGAARELGVTRQALYEWLDRNNYHSVSTIRSKVTSTTPE